MDTSDTTSLPGLTPAAQAVTQLPGAIGDERPGAPTSCPEHATRELPAHLEGLSLAFRDAARKDLGPTTDTSPTASLPFLEGGRRARIPVRLDEFAGVWRPRVHAGGLVPGFPRVPAAPAVALPGAGVAGFFPGRVTARDT
ncbi:hypothetical protein [Streptomyces incanus]|uniref:Uncharacterized protein n=1 Tax=Streptomyces incanus TaxID=887453 RepID=A0ABW0Y404_9ACTN